VPWPAPLPATAPLERWQLQVLRTVARDLTRAAPAVRTFVLCELERRLRAGESAYSLTQLHLRDLQLPAEAAQYLRNRSQAQR
jgi:hypothetical protein